MAATNTFVFNQIHIEAARNASDDFNLFHDKHKWLQITHNPFKGPIALGFQLNCLIEYQIRLHRIFHHENSIIEENKLRFSNYQITFVNAVKPDRPVSLEIRKTLIKTIPSLTLGNRISLKSNGKTVLLGFKKETQVPLFLAETELRDLPDLTDIPDCCDVPDTKYFLKRKYLNNGNAKNFLSGSHAEQADYFDEWNDKANYPEIFPCSLISGALLENIQMEDYDFVKNPLVYTAHHLSVDREYVKTLKNQDTLHILVDKLPQDCPSDEAGSQQRVYECFGLVGDNNILFRAKLFLTPLEAILNTLRQR